MGTRYDVHTLAAWEDLDGQKGTVRRFVAGATLFRVRLARLTGGWKVKIDRCKGDVWETVHQVPGFGKGNKAAARREGMEEAERFARRVQREQEAA